jgi:hypothetical protein
MTRRRVYYERGRPVEVLTWWGTGGGPHNVLIRRASGELLVRPFCGLRKAAAHPAKAAGAGR